MEDLAAISAREVMSSRREKRKRGVFLCRRTVRVNVKSKVIPTSFMKIEGRRMFVGEKDRGRLVELGSHQKQGQKAPPRSKTGRKGGTKEMSGEERQPEE